MKRAIATALDYIFVFSPLVIALCAVRVSLDDLVAGAHLTLGAVAALICVVLAARAG